MFIGARLEMSILYTLKSSDKNERLKSAGGFLPCGMLFCLVLSCGLYIAQSGADWKPECVELLQDGSCEKHT